MAGEFHAKVAALIAGLEHDEHRDAARLALRGLVVSIVIQPGVELLRLRGNLGEMQATAAGPEGPRCQNVA